MQEGSSLNLVMTSTRFQGNVYQYETCAEFSFDYYSGTVSKVISLSHTITPTPSSREGVDNPTFVHNHACNNYVQLADSYHNFKVTLQHHHCPLCMQP